MNFIKTVETQKNFYIIGDIHGEFDKLINLLKKLPKDANKDNIIFCGDLIDRGSDSRKVINFIRENDYLCVRGNHEDLLIDAVRTFDVCKSPLELSTWFSSGGHATLENYKIDGKFTSKSYKMLKEDVDFLDSLPYAIEEIGDDNRESLLVTHAPSFEFYDALKNGTPREKMRASRMVTNNRNVVSHIKASENNEKYFNISGHNILGWIENSERIRKVLDGNSFKKTYYDKKAKTAFIDTGAFIKDDDNDSKYCGYLSCVRFPNFMEFSQK